MDRERSDRVSFLRYIGELKLAGIIDEETHQKIFDAVLEGKHDNILGDD